MKRYIRSAEDITAMSNVRGNLVKNPNKLPFSFYFSSKNGNVHGPRVKTSFDPSKLRLSKTGTLKLCDDWEFIKNPQDRDVSESEIKKMKEFFRKYLILFLLVWDDYIGDPVLEDYFEGDITLHEFITELDFYEEFRDILDEINTVEDLETFCRENGTFNFYGN